MYPVDPVALITFWQLASIILPILLAIAAAAFLILCVVGYVLWYTRRGLGDDAVIDTDAEWFEAL